MEKYQLNHALKESIEYFRGIDYLSHYGILKRIVSDSKGDEVFYQHGQKVLKHFNDFDNKEDDYNFMKCMLGHYKVVNKAVCFTGHRPEKLNGYSMMDNIPLIKELREIIIDHIENKGVTIFISGMALGVDMWAATIVTSLKGKYPHIKLICAVPCREQWARWTEESIEEWKGIIAVADIVHYVSVEPFTPWCMEDRNRWMVNNSDGVIAVWDGTKGGTRNCVSYAMKKELPITALNPNSLEKELLH